VVGYLLNTDEFGEEGMQENAQDRRMGLSHLIFCGQAHVATKRSTIAVPHKYTIPVVKI